MRNTWFLALTALAAAPASASEASIAYFTEEKAAALPDLLTEQERLDYRSLFEAIEAQNWDRAEVLFAEKQQSPLLGAALAEYYLHANSPRIPLERLEAWLATYADLPRAGDILRLAETRGFEGTVDLPRERETRRQRGITRRILPRSVEDGTMPGAIRASILERIRNDDPDGARLLLDGIDATLSPEARAEWRRRVAWSYYIENRDAEALGLARTVAEGSGRWVAEGDWVVGLSAWRLGDCSTAANAFQSAAAAGSDDPELASSAHYWASRALVRCREPEKATEQLRGAARFTETLYGMLAREQLGQALPGDHTRPDLTAQDWRELEREPAARLAVMLSSLGQDEAASAAITHQARIGDPDDFSALARLARALGLTDAQRYLAYNAPSGATSPVWLRWPVTDQQPVGGWKVDPALAFAHALQESSFRERVVSPAGAIGLMQITPITRREFAASIAMSSGADLKEPRTNLAFGQRTLEAYANSSYARRQLPKVMAAYNAGPTPVTRWESEVRDQDDPLTWMESLPYWETRGYVNIVMRNYWMYLRQADAEAPSRVELAQNRWPVFPEER